MSVTHPVRRRSPLIARRQLAAALRGLRESTKVEGTKLTAHQLATKIRMDRSRLSRIETGERIATVADVQSILRGLGLDESTASDGSWHEMVQLAEASGDRGWWSDYPAIGKRQAVYANLESGASTVQEFQSFAVPGLLHVPEYTRVRAELDRLNPSALDAAVEAKLMRGRMLRRPDGPTYEVVIDESAVRRPSAPRPVMLAQVDHLAKLAAEGGKMTILILEQRAEIEGFWIPRGAFSIYEFGEGDPTAAAVDTELDDLILTEPVKVRPYSDLYARLRAAALSASDSAAWLRAEYETIRG